MESNQWAQDLQQEVYQYWKENANDWNHGFRVFYGPVHDSAEILILGYQPGGGPSSFIDKRADFEDGDFSLPETHDYISEDWPLAREMRDLFGEYDEVLAESVKTNVIFFRAPNIDYWKSNLSKDRRDELRRYCFAKVQEIVERIGPSVIIAEGIMTWDELKSVFDLTSEVRLSRGRERLFCMSQEARPKFVGIMHPSGARISLEDKRRIRTELFDVINSRTSYSLTT